MSKLDEGESMCSRAIEDLQTELSTKIGETKLLNQVISQRSAQLYTLSQEKAQLEQKVSQQADSIVELYGELNKIEALNQDALEREQVLRRRFDMLGSACKVLREEIKDRDRTRADYIR